MRRELEAVRVPGEEESQERARVVVLSAFAEREPVRRPSRWPRVAVVAVALAAIGAAAVSSPGRAVLHELREVVGVKRAQPALFSLPAPGRLLVASDAGVWIVEQDGSKRLLGEYREASWSPLGRFVVATKQNELAALEPDGDVRWTLARRGVRSPRWTGTDVDTRIAYVDRTGLRVVAGDGTGDRLLVPGFRGPIAWKPGPEFVLAYAASGTVRVVDARVGKTIWQAPAPPGRAVVVEWSSDGRRLLVLSPQLVRKYDRAGRILEENGASEGWPTVDATFRSGTGQITVAIVHGAQSTVHGLEGRRLPPFNGTGVFRQVLWSPDGRWYLVTWPTADQWVFVRASGAKRIRAVAGVSEQFRSRSTPRIEGWCCAR